MRSAAPGKPPGINAATQSNAMRAAMITEYRQPLEIVNVVGTELPKDSIIMKVRPTGVCRSDWHILMGHYRDRIRLPSMPGLPGGMATPHIRDVIHADKRQCDYRCGVAVSA